MYLCIITFKINHYMKKFLNKIKEVINDFIGGALEEEYVDMQMKQRWSTYK